MALLVGVGVWGVGKEVLVQLGSPLHCSCVYHAPCRTLRHFQRMSDEPGIRGQGIADHEGFIRDLCSLCPNADEGGKGSIPWVSP